MLTVNLAQDKSEINNYISSTLLKSMEIVLKKWEKTILYLNKRGEYSCLICTDCQKLYKCDNCDNSFSVHRSPPKIICHLCGYSENIPLKCNKNKCNSSNLEKLWVGIQQIENSLNNYFKQKVNIFRFDSDNLKTKKSKNEALNDLKIADIIIWTKMVTTGFNFDNVWLIGVILLEQELQIPKYNTEEKVYSNIKQLLGRGNRVWQKTDIIIQSFIPDNEIIKKITSGNYKDFFISSLEERKIFNYPPFVEMLTIEYRDMNKEKASIFIIKLYNKLILQDEKREFDITFIKTPFKKYNQYYFKIILKGKNTRDFLEWIKFEIMRNKWLSIIFE